MRRTLQGLIATTGLCTLLGSAALTQAQEKEEPTNPKPTQLILKRVKDNAAVIAARFPTHKPGGEVQVRLQGEPVTLVDTGEQGDEEPEDGLFSIATEFDFEAFARANKQLAEQSEGNKQPLFAPGGREQIGVQTTFVEDEHLIVEQRFERREKHFALPLDPALIEPGQRLELPLIGRPLAVPIEIELPRLTTDPDKSLMITDLNVVNDPTRTWACSSTNQSPSGNATGEWTFWQLMANINNGTSSTSAYIKDLFDNWNQGYVVNGDPVGARPNVYDEVIRQWENRSGGPGAPLLPSESPFKLLGIVLRADLRGGGSLYSGGDAGEGRFVFSLHDGNCNSLGKTIILEYKVPVRGCTAVREWAQEWKALAFSNNYNDDLAQLTRVFSEAGAAPGRPNDSAISQVRTNELLAASPEWELREYRLESGGGFLEPHTTIREPQRPHNNSQLLADYINANATALINQTHDVPLDFQGDDFRAAHAPAPLMWNVPNSQLGNFNKAEAEFGLALNTCSGCHSLETGTSFAHLHYNTQAGQPAILSAFLTGTSLPDPREPSIMRQFDDLQRRANDLDNLAASACPDLGDLPLGNGLTAELSLPRPLQAVH